MKLATLFTVIILLFSLESWAQEKEEPAPEVEEEAAEQEDGNDNTEKTPKKPVRLPSSLERERIPDSEDGSMKLLAQYLSKDALLWLDTEHGQFLSLWQKDRSGDPKGALMIIHAEGEHPAWPNTTKPLHDTLPDYGWATLAISLPTPDLKKIPERTLAVKVKKKVIQEDENTEEQENTEAIAEDETKDKKEPEESKKPETVAASIPAVKPNSPTAEQITEKRLEAALQFLHDQGQFNLIVLGSGYGAIRAHDFLDKITPKIDNPKLKAKLERPVRAMIIVNGRNQLPTMEEAYSDWFSDPGIPILDIFEQGDQRNVVEAKVRKVLAKQKKVAVYKQVKLVSLSHQKSWEENKLSRRVRSFLDSNAVGIEVKNAKLRRYK